MYVVGLTGEGDRLVPGAAVLKLGRLRPEASECFVTGLAAPTAAVLCACGMPTPVEGPEKDAMDVGDRDELADETEPPFDLAILDSSEFDDSLEPLLDLSKEFMNLPNRLLLVLGLTGCWKGGWMSIDGIEAWWNPL